MPTRALPDLVARIRLDSSGTDQAMSNLVSSFGRANLALAGLGAGIGLLVMGGKSMIDIAEKHEQAQLGLTQAYKVAGLNLQQYQARIDEFITTNRRYISDQSEVIDGFAKLTRSGLNQTEVTRVMNDAVDLAALKHISLSDAVQLLDAAEHGRLRGLIDLGITTAKFTDAQGNLIQSSHSVAQAMGEVDAKVKGGKNSITDNEQAWNRLSNDWQDLANRGGPQLLGAIRAIENSAASLYDWFDRLGKDDKLWATISARLAGLAAGMRSVALELGIAQPAGSVPKGPWSMSVYWDSKSGTFQQGGPIPVGSYVNPTTGVVMTPGYPTDHPTDAQGKAGGGSVLPGRIYSVGESEQETLIMNASGGGQVVPSGRGRASQSPGGTTYNVTVNVAGSVQTERGINLAIREGLRQLDREQR